MNIKRLNKKDLIDVFNLVVQLSIETRFYAPSIKSFLEAWNSFIDSGAGAIFGALKGKNIVGIISGICYKDATTGIKTAYEMHFYVEDKFRRAGIGRELYKKFLEWSKDKECKLVYLAHPVGKSWMKKIFGKVKPLEIHYIKEI